MFTSADLIEALRQRRRLKSIRPDTPGQLPPGWQQWLEAMPARVGAVIGALPQAFVDIFLQRPLSVPPRRVDQLNRWQAFATLWRQQWRPPVREERGQRWFAIFFSALLHFLFVVMLLWLAYIRIIAMPPQAQGDSVVQVEFIGEGTPDEEGGGAPAGEKPQPEQAPAAAAPAAAPPQPQPATAPEVVAAEPQPEPTPPAPAEQPEPQPPTPTPPASQPLQVTEVQVPDTEFVLPPPTPRVPRLQQREITVPELRQRPELTEVEAPQPVVTPTEQPTREIVKPRPPQAAPEEPEVAVRLPQARAREVRTTAAPEIRVPTANAELREIPMPSTGTAAASAASASTAATPASSATSAPNATAPEAGGTPAASSGTQPSATASGTGSAPSTKPGAWPTPAKADDWGASTRNRPGGAPGGKNGEKPGLFDADGTPRLADAPGSASPGQPPGTVTQEIKDLDRAGTWLKRPPYDYRPTMFDRFWVPRETLLQEWVRKGIKKLSIPIPGTSKRLECVVSILQVGGGCGISDSDMNEQPARARPPPDIPFKPHLQEDNGSVKPPAQ